MKPVAACVVALTGFGAATGATAQDLVYSDTATLACVQGAVSAPARRACIGRSADQCMQATPMGSSTRGMGGCLDRELAFWDARLNQNYRAAIAKAKAVDADTRAVQPDTPLIEPALRQMQRAWIPFRDASCDFAAAQWGGGSGRGPALLGCLTQMTGEQALNLADNWIGQ